MRIPPFALAFALLVAPGCAEEEPFAPPTTVDSGMNPPIVVPPVTRRDSGTDAGHRDGGADPACLSAPEPTRLLFVIDRSETMGDVAIEGDGLAFHVLASQAARQLVDELDVDDRAGLLLFPSAGFDGPDCADVDPLSQQYPLREPSELGLVLDGLWAAEALMFGKPRAQALLRAAEALDEGDLSDVLVVLLSDSAAACVSGGEIDGAASLLARGARVVSVTLGASSGVGGLPIYSRVSEVVAALQPALHAARHRCPSGA